MTTDATKAVTKIALGISGDIARTRACIWPGYWSRQDSTSLPLLTRSARQFVTPLSLSVLTGNRAITNLWTASEVGVEVSHVELAHAIGPLSSRLQPQTYFCDWLEARHQTPFQV